VNSQREKILVETAAPRFEFRAFAPNFGIVEKKIRGLSSLENIWESNEIYIIAAENDTHNIKIRDNYLDIKILLKKKRGLEQWKPFVKLAFPISAQKITHEILPIYSIKFTDLKQRSYSVQELLHEVVDRCSELIQVNVYKRRFGFTINACIVEIAEVIVNGAAIKTVAIESVDIEKVLQVKRLIHLSAYENVNYLLELKRITGLASLPDVYMF
jgi:hypothetical protein